MNNWLGFSLSPQELQDHPVPHLGFNSDEISTAHGESSCFDLPSDSSLPSANLPAPPFGLLEDFNPLTHSQDWNMNTFSCSSQELEDQNKPKLENFLGVHQEQKSSNLYHQLNIYKETDAASHTNWLSNKPVQLHAAANSKAAAPATAQSLSLSMSTTDSQSSFPLPLDSKLGSVAVESAPRRSVDTFGQRTSIYRGVTRHRWTGRYEAHLWDNSCRREGQSRKGRQVYLGGYDKEDKAARSYDLVALKYWGATTTTNFPMSNYEKEIEEMKHMTRQEFVASIRRKSSGFSRGASIYRGVTRHHQHGRWQARIGRVAGNKDLYLGTFTTEEEAAEAYDIAAIKFRGLTAVTNFEMNRYDVKSILESAALPIRGAAKRLKDGENADFNRVINDSNLNLNRGQTSSHGWPTVAFHPLSIYPYDPQMVWCKQEPDPYVIRGFNNHLQPSVLHNIMSFDSTNVEQSSGCSRVVYGSNGSGDGDVVGMMGGNIPSHGNDYEGMFGSADGYNHQEGRNLYYQQSSSDLVKGGSDLCDQAGSASTNWIPSGVSTDHSRSNKEDGRHEASTFTAWNDT